MPPQYGSPPHTCQTLSFLFNSVPNSLLSLQLSIEFHLI